MEQSFKCVRMAPSHPHWPQAIARHGGLYHRPGDFRSEFERDYTRIIHSTAYSRLKHKTQVFFTTKNDHISTRMDHVTQVASVSCTIGRYLGLNTELINAIANGHDIGHSPFGHVGESILRTICQAELGQSFWHEQQGLRVVDDMETLLDPTGKTQNLMLTYAVRDGIISHCGEVRQHILRPRDEAMPLSEITRPSQYEPYTWEGCVVKISDKIAYLGRDIEDAIRLRILTEDGAPLQTLKEMLQDRFHEQVQSVSNTAIMYRLVTDLCAHSTPETGLQLSPDYGQLMNDIMQFNYKYIYHSKRLAVYRAYAKLIIESIYNTLKEGYDGTRTLARLQEMEEDYPTLGKHFQERLRKFSDIGRAAYKEDTFGNAFGNHIMYCIEKGGHDYRLACIDYIAGMTDTYAEKIFDELTTF